MSRKRRKNLPTWFAILMMAVFATGLLKLAESRPEIRSASERLGVPDLIGQTADFARGKVLSVAPQSLRRNPAITPREVLASAPRNFEHAKTLLRPIFARAPFDAYCGCRFDPNTYRVDAAACGLRTNKFVDRAGRIEFEHVIPVSSYARQRECWRKPPPGVSGREHCRATDAEFAAIEGDPYNLLPTIGALNAVRGTYRYAEIPGERREFGGCDFEVDRGSKTVEPPAWIKGDIARIHLYFEWRYGFRISSGQRRLFEAWARMDPTDELEIIRVASIAERVGWTNHFVLSPDSQTP